VWKATSSTRGRLRERAGRQVLELGHAQVGDSDEVAASPEAPCSTFGLLQQPVHGLRSSTVVGEKGVFWAAFWHRGLEKSIA